MGWMKVSYERPRKQTKYAAIVEEDPLSPSEEVEEDEEEIHDTENAAIVEEDPLIPSEEEEEEEDEEEIHDTEYAAMVEEDPLSEEEEEDEEEIHDTEDDSSVQSKQDKTGMPATLMDTDVLDCSICMNPLSPPVFQCENGHIACSLCCTQLGNKCPTCSCPVGKIRCLAIEKVIGSIKVSCAYNPYGCTKTFLYLQKETHEGTCIHIPCKCPGKDCDFRGSSKQLSLHISSKHPNIITQFHFSDVVTMRLGKLDESVVLWEKEHDTLFVVNNQIELIGSAISVECLGPSPSSGGFCCELVSKKGANSLKLECDVECVTERKTSSSVDFLLIPYYIYDKVCLEICIWERS